MSVSPSPARRRENRRVALVTASVVATFVAIMTACSDQGEGERCEVSNHDDDCKAGLICYPAAQLNASSDRCCPRDRTTSTDPICKGAVSVIGDAQPPQDTGPSTTTTDSGSKPDAAGDASTSDASDAASTSDASDASDQ